MASLEEEIQQWIILQSSLLIDGNIKSIPKPEELSPLLSVKNKIVWKFIVKHLHSEINADRIRRILKLKCEQDRCSNDVVLPPRRSKIDEFRKKISKATEKREFYRKNRQTLQEEIANLEREISSIKCNINETSQRTAFYETMILQYKEKCSVIYPVKEKLLHYSKHKALHQIPNRDPSSTLNSESRPAETRNLLKKVNFLLKEKLTTGKPGKDIIRRIKYIMEGMPLTTLLHNLQELCKESSLATVKSENLELFMSRTEKDLKKRESYLLLQKLKMQHVKSIFDTKQSNLKISRLKNENNSLLSICQSTADIELKEKYEYFFVAAENSGIRQSIKYLEDELIYLEKITSELKSKEHTTTISELEGAKKKFYHNFDMLNWLVLSFSDISQAIQRNLIDTQMYMKQDMFSSWHEPWITFPTKMDEELKYKVHNTKDMITVNGFFTPILGHLCLSDLSSKLETVYSGLNIPCFQHPRLVPLYNDRLQNYISSYLDSQFQYHEQSFSLTKAKFMEYQDVYKKIFTILGESDSELHLCLKTYSEVKLCLKDYNEQGAQYIPNIIVDGKSLKMWIDILLTVNN